MRVRLSLRDRIVLAAMLPAQGNFVQMELIAKLRSNLLLNAQEMSEVALREQTGGGFVWDATKDPMKTFRFYASELEIFRNVLATADKDGKLTADHIQLYRLFAREGDDVVPPQADLANKISGMDLAGLQSAPLPRTQADLTYPFPPPAPPAPIIPAPIELEVPVPAPAPDVLPMP